MKKVFLFKDSYYDSIFLMQINAEILKISGLTQATIAMGTPYNLERLTALGFGDQIKNATASDLIIAIDCESAAIQRTVETKIDELLHQASPQDEAQNYRPVSIAEAKKLLPGANLAVISLPGTYAGFEAKRALQHDLHVLLFSDNVPIEEEVELKRLANEMGLLLMGPDCGTAIINGKPLGFANAIRRGSIGIVGASGTGIQEISVLIDDLGFGVSQAIGTGGRDLSASVGGLTMLQGISALAKDPQTEVILVCSKPPEPEIAEKVVSALAACGKPTVVHFVGTKVYPEAPHVRPAFTLEEAAVLSANLAQGNNGQTAPLSMPQPLDSQPLEALRKGLSKKQRYIRGLYSGGTLCDEALFILSEKLSPIYSNIHPQSAFRLNDPRHSVGHCLIDLGDDAFTVGRPHPMIDPSTRIERIEAEADDPEVAAILFDVVLGFGSHADPAGALLPALSKAQQKSKKRGGKLLFIAHVVGTEADSQRLSMQRQKLEEHGVLVQPSNAQAARLALYLVEEIR